MKTEFWESRFLVSDLLYPEVDLKGKVWLKNDELFIQKTDGLLEACLLVKDGEQSSAEETLSSYLRFICLVSDKGPKIESMGASGLRSKSDFGKSKDRDLLCIEEFISEEIACEIEKHAPRFIQFIGELHDNYIETVSNNPFMEVALDYLYDAGRKSVYSDEGFVSCMISMEALFNDSPNDIKHKLSLRAAFLLELSGMVDGVDAFGHLAVLYNKRSKLVHGNGALSYSSEIGFAAHYARQCINIFLILLQDESRKKIKKGDRKKNLLSEIDHAMLSVDRRKQLESEIINGLKRFKLPVPRVFEANTKYGHERKHAW